MSRKIYIDAGHGGVQPGACNGKRKESDDVLRLALKLQVLLSVGAITQAQYDEIVKENENV